MHNLHPLLLLAPLTLIFLALCRMSAEKQSGSGANNDAGKNSKSCGCNHDRQSHEQPAPTGSQSEPPAPQNLTAPAPASSEAVQDKLSQDEREQLRQVLALADAVKALEIEFLSRKAALLPDENSLTGDERTVALRRECATIKEQIRIAKSDVSYLMVFVMAPYQSLSNGQHVPSFKDASWAFTAGHLSLSFARARVIKLA